MTRRVTGMHKLAKVFVLAMFSLITTQSSYANYPNYEGYSNYPQGQAAYSQDLYNQTPPDISGENTFIMQSGNRMNQMMQSNRNMISEDYKMMKQGYDPNENYYGGETRNIQGLYRSYPNQEQMMQGSSGGYSQSYYNAAMPQSYPLNRNYPNAPQNDNQQEKQGNSNNKMASYDYRSYHYQPDQYIGDSTNDMPPSSSRNHGVSNTDTNASWDTTDDQTMRQSSANTSQSSRWDARNQ